MKKSKRDKRNPATSFYSRIKEYDRILRSGGSFAGGVAVYGNDKNLAVVSMDGMGESVKYIELKHIRAVLIKRFEMAPRAAVLGFLLLVVLVVLYFSIGGFTYQYIVSSLIATLFTVLLLLGIKNCSLRIVTDVNDHHITSVHRYNVAKKLLDFVAAHMQPYLAEAEEETEAEKAEDELQEDEIPEPPLVEIENSPPVTVAPDEELPL